MKKRYTINDLETAIIDLRNWEHLSEKRRKELEELYRAVLENYELRLGIA